MGGISKGCEYIVSFDCKKNPKQCNFPTESSYTIVAPLGKTTMLLCSNHANKLSQEHLHWKFFRHDSQEFKNLQRMVL